MTREALLAIVDRMADWPEDKQEAAVELLRAMDSWPDESYPVSKEDIEDIRAALKETETVSHKDLKTLLERYRCLLALERLGPDIYVLSEEEEADIAEAMAEIERGEVASDEEVAAVFNRYR